MPREKAIRSRAWNKLADFEQEQLVMKIPERKKGGFFVNVGALKAFYLAHMPLLKQSENSQKI